jgi:hypothetical protein
MTDPVRILCKEKLTCNALHGYLLRVTPRKSLHFTAPRYTLHEELVVSVQ